LMALSYHPVRILHKLPYAAVLAREHL